MTDRLAYRVPEVCKMLGISKSMFYKLTQAGKISTLKLGSMTLVKRTELERLMEPPDATPDLAVDRGG